jgi:hypothetical protein
MIKTASIIAVSTPIAASADPHGAQYVLKRAQRRSVPSSMGGWARTPLELDLDTLLKVGVQSVTC